MAKRPTLAAVGAFRTEPDPPVAAVSPIAANNDQPAKAKTAGSRAGKKATPFWVNDAAKKQFDFMTVEQDSTAQALLTEALNDLFRKYDKPPIA